MNFSLEFHLKKLLTTLLIIWLRDPPNTNGMCLQKISTKIITLLFSSTLFTISTLHPIKIAEVNYLTHHSKYYNQAVEVYNRYTNRIRLTEYYLISRNGQSERTNEIKLWSANGQEKFSHLNPVHDEWIDIGETAVILDLGYPDNGLAEDYNLNGIKIFTTSTGVLGETSFIKEDDILFLKDIQYQQVDEFHLQPTTTGFSVNRTELRVDDSIADSGSLILQAQSIGSNNFASQPFSSGDPDQMILEEINHQPIIAGRPQKFQLQYMDKTYIATNNSRSVYLEEEDYFKLYYVGETGNLNLLNDSDEITFNLGQSFILTGFGKTVGQFQLISDLPSQLQNIPIEIIDFNHPSSKQLYLSEIYYNTNKDRAWFELFVSDSIDFTTNLTLELYNSEYALRHEYSLNLSTLTDGWYVVAFTNHPNNTFNLPNQLIPLNRSLELTASGVILLREGEQILEIVHYNKGWLSDSTNYRYSLQRTNFNDFAFDRNDWVQSMDYPTSPGLPNQVDTDYQFNLELVDSEIPIETKNISIRTDLPSSGSIEGILYTFEGVKLGLIWLEDVEQGPNQVHQICLKKADLEVGLYHLEVHYYGKKEHERNLYFHVFD